MRVGEQQSSTLIIPVTSSTAVTGSCLAAVSVSARAGYMQREADSVYTATIPRIAGRGSFTNWVSLLSKQDETSPG